MPALIRLRQLAAAATVDAAPWAKLEHVHPSGSIYDRVAALQLASTSELERGVVVSGSAPWCLALTAACARLGLSVKRVLISPPVLHELRVLLRSTALDVIEVPADARIELARSAAAELDATWVPEDASAHFASTVGAELAQDRATMRSVPFNRVFAPEDEHGLIAGLVLAGHSVVAARATPDATWGRGPASLSEAGSASRSAAGSSSVLAEDAPPTDAPPTRLAELLAATANATGAAESRARARRRNSAMDESGRGASSHPAERFSSVEVIEVDDLAAHAMRGRAARSEGLLVGHASAAALHAAVEHRGGGAVALIVDAGDRVFSRDAELAP